MSWNVDPSHTRINFSVRHMMISWVHGTFANATGKVHFDPDTPANSYFEIQIVADSLSTGDDQRDAHLKSPDFLNIVQYPTIYFKSKAVEGIDQNHGRLVGDLTIKDVSREVVLDVEYAGMAKNPFGAYSAGFTATSKINRKDWGLEWNVALETGGWLVGDTINITVELELVRQAEVELNAV